MKTVEVFKTNVVKKQDARTIIKEIGSHQPGYKCNFDLDDCDKILRIENASGKVDAKLVFNILEKNNCSGAILE